VVNLYYGDYPAVQGDYRINYISTKKWKMTSHVREAWERLGRYPDSFEES